jgi:hypothetical protein
MHFVGGIGGERMFFCSRCTSIIFLDVCHIGNDKTTWCTFYRELCKDDSLLVWFGNFPPLENMAPVVRRLSE